MACNDRKAFFTSSDQSRYTLWSCQNVCDTLSYLLDNIYIRFGTKLYRQIVGFPMGTNCAPLVADLFLYCYERDFMDSLNHDNQADVIEAYEMFSWYKYLIFSLVFSHLGFWSGSLFLIAPFPDLCLLVLFSIPHLGTSMTF